jgi:hypothetical protein
MAWARIDTALELAPTVTRFFRGPISVTCRWTAAGPRVQDDPRLLTQVFRGLPSALASGIDAALIEPEARPGDGERAALFKGNRWFRFNLRFETPEPDPPALLDLSTWGLPAAFATGVDAVLDGRGQYAGKWYFFRGNRYCAVRKSDRSVEAPALRDVAAWHTPFTGGVDAATNGFGPADGTAFFVNGVQAVPYSWATDRATAAPASLLTMFPGVIEMLHAGRATVEAREWVAAARTALGAPGSPRPTGPVTVAALGAHFKAGWPGVLDVIRTNFATLDARLAAMPDRYRFRTRAEAVTDRVPAGTPAYADNGIVSFTPDFVDQTDLSQAAMVVHEMFHTIDAASGDDIFTHVSEWELTRDIQVAARLAVRQTTYPAQRTINAVHNPSAYAAFAQHVRFGIDTRFGAGRDDEDVSLSLPGI